MKLAYAFLFSSAAMLALPAAPAVADSYFAADILYGSPDVIGDSFGSSVSASQSRVAVGAPGTPCAAPMVGVCGAVYIFGRSTGLWTQEAFLRSPTPQDESTFGLSVSIDGDWLIVGAPFEDRLAGSDAGNAYLFHYASGAWTTADLNAPDEAGARLGRSVAISASGIALAGMPYESRSTPPALSHNGAVAGFVRDGSGNWSYESVVRVETPTSDAYFGSAVALHAYVIPPGILTGFSMAVGAPGATLLGQANAGKGYAFNRTPSDSSWTQRAAYGIGPSAGAGDNFGAAVAIDGAFIAFGVPKHATPTSHTGSVYVVHRNGTDWASYSLVEVPPAFDAQDGMQYGAAVALDGSTLFVGAPHTEFFTTPPTTLAGGVYWYERQTTGGWAFQTRLRAEQPSSSAQFGAAVAYSGNLPAFGAPGQLNPAAQSTGAVHLFAKDVIFVDGFDE